MLGRNDFVFVGRRIIKHDDGKITLSQSHYASDVIISKNKQDPSEKMGKIVKPCRSFVRHSVHCSG